MPYKLPAAPEPDDLLTPEVGRWAEDKYKLVSLYDRLFSTAMKNKWDIRVYIDLYAGAGFARIRNTDRLVYGSPLLALAVTDPFNKHIFCEADASLPLALQKRVDRLFPKSDVTYVYGDCNERTHQICAAIPEHSKIHTVLSFCFVDPPNISIKFSTMRALSHQRKIDFVVLLALYMDANRNEQHYTSKRNSKVDEFLGTTSWRARWKHERLKGIKFPRFLAEEYSRQMETLGYINLPFHKMKKVRADKNQPLYHLALFSRNKFACTLWDEVLKYSTDQIPLLGNA